MISVGERVYKTVGELVREDYRTASVLKKYGIDFYCGGRKSIVVACEEKSINPDLLEAEIASLVNEPFVEESNYNEWTLSFMIDYMVQINHKYLTNGMKVLQELSVKAVENNIGLPAAARIYTVLNEINEELEVHLKKESYIIFPYIKSMEKFLAGDLKKMPLTHLVTLKSPIRMMEQEHELMGLMMAEIRSLCHNYALPSNSSHWTLFNRLEDYEENLQKHIHIENNILFPKALLLEERLQAFKNH